MDDGWKGGQDPEAYVRYLKERQNMTTKPEAVTQHALEAAKDYLRGNGPWKDSEIGITEDDYLVQCFAKAIREAKRQERAATFAFIREQAWKEEVVEAQQAVFGPNSPIRPPARLMVSLMNKAMLDQIERTQNDA